jgi:acyl CoA:acetate/3-ketoacid CoA transferase alpha subunit
MSDKVKTITEVVQSIPDGSHIALGGFAIARNSIVFAHEIIRQRKKTLTLSQGVMGMETDLLVGAGLVAKLIVGGGSLDRFGPVRCINRAREDRSLISIDSSSLSLAFGINRAREDRSLISIDSSSLSLAFGYLAGALGISFISIKSLLASEMMERLEDKAPDYLRRGTCPFTGEEFVFLRALTPDVSIVHVQVADRDGNCWINGPRWENEEQAKAGKRVIVVTEELVPTEFIQRSPERTVIPGHRVEAVVHQPFGGHPTGVFGCYDYDSEHLKVYTDHHKTPEGMSRYLDTYIYGTRDHWDYLEKIGGARRLNEIKAEAVYGY